MSENTVRVIGHIDPPPPDPLKIRVIATDENKGLSLMVGGNVLASARATEPNGAGKWVIGFSSSLAPAFVLNGFFVTSRAEAVDALADVGKLYHAAKMGALK